MSSINSLNEGKILILPIAPLSRSKSRLSDCFSKEQLKDLTIAMFKDLARTLTEVKCFKEKIVYCNSSEILELAGDYGLIGIKEEITRPQGPFDDVIKDLNHIAIEKFNARETVVAFLDLILITAKNFYDIDSLMKKSQVVVCPAMRSGGISILGRKPPEIIPSSFSDPNVPSFIALYNNAKKNGIKISIYDSFKAGFDVDIRQDIILAHEYLKIFNLTHTNTFNFLKKNLKFSLQKRTPTNNREFVIKKIID